MRKWKVIPIEMMLILLLLVSDHGIDSFQVLCQSPRNEPSIRARRRAAIAPAVTDGRKETSSSKEDIIGDEGKGPAANNFDGPSVEPASEVALSEDGSYFIRDAHFYDMGAACALLVSGFFGQTVWFAPLCMRELHRLQSNFPAPDSKGVTREYDRHRMLVVELSVEDDHSEWAPKDITGSNDNSSEGSPTSPSVHATSSTGVAPSPWLTPQEQAAAAIAGLHNSQMERPQPFSCLLATDDQRIKGDPLVVSGRGDDDGGGGGGGGGGGAEATAVAAAARRLIGFVDVDARPPKVPQSDDAPRPYLSDLAVCGSARRRGIAWDLMRRCEDIVHKDWGFDRLYLKVERTNVPAMKLYLGRGYKVEKEYAESNKVLMCKQFISRHKEGNDT